MRIMATVEYIGSNYCGYQTQPNGISIQEVLEEKLSQLLGEKIKITASGRTDAGVHARGQIIHFDTTGSFPIERIPIAAGGLLPHDISITHAMVVDASFHARYSAKKKKYGYKIFLSRVNSPFMANLAYQCPYVLDVDLMKTALTSLVGQHDFRAFMSTGSSVDSTVRTIYSIDIIADKDMINIEVTGSGFLYNMVRIIVGTLIDIGRGRLSNDAISQMIATGDRGLGGATAPACGLYLLEVDYS